MKADSKYNATIVDAHGSTVETKMLHHARIVVGVYDLLQPEESILLLETL